MGDISPKYSSDLQLFHLRELPETNIILNHPNLTSLLWSKMGNRARYIWCVCSSSEIVGGGRLNNLLGGLLLAVLDSLLGFQTLHPLLLCKAGCGFCSLLMLALTKRVVWVNVDKLQIAVRLPVIKACPTTTPQGQTTRTCCYILNSKEWTTSYSEQFVVPKYL